MSNDTSIQAAIGEMLSIVERLRRAHGRSFTLDGKLVGDIGEVLVQDHYDVTLFDDLRKYHDGYTSDGRLVQVKTTMQSALTFPADHIPNYYLGIKVHPDGSFTEIFNGPGALAWEAVKCRKQPKTNLHAVPIGALAALNKRVQPKDRVARRKTVHAR